MLEALLVLAALYFAPTLIAMIRGHHNSVAIFILNALLGWTVLGWVIAFVWSLTAVMRPIVALPTGVPAMNYWGQLAPSERPSGASTILIVAAITLLVLMLLS